MTWLSDGVAARLRTLAGEPDFGGTRYRLLREIGRGGMGVVYEAEDIELARRVAVKVLAPELTGADAAGRVRAEARVIAQLEHPGIVPVHDAGTLSDGRVFYVMKLVRGRTLAEGASLRDCLRVCEAVAFAHARGIIHCDLKPSNVMVGELGEVLVMDWGVARAVGGVAPAGTPGFMPPEQERGHSVDTTADVFALGKLLDAINASTPTLPRRLRAIIRKATAGAASERYPSAMEMAADLERYLEGEAVSAHPEGAIERAGRWLARNRALVAVIVAYLVMRAVVLLVAHR